MQAALYQLALSSGCTDELLARLLPLDPHLVRLLHLSYGTFVMPKHVSMFDHKEVKRRVELLYNLLMDEEDSGCGL